MHFVPNENHKFVLNFQSFFSKRFFGRTLYSNSGALVIIKMQLYLLWCFFIFYVFSHERFSPFVASSLEVNARTLPADSHKEKIALKPIINYESQNINWGLRMLGWKNRFGNGRYFAPVYMLENLIKLGGLVSVVIYKTTIELF